MLAKSESDSEQKKATLAKSEARDYKEKAGYFKKQAKYYEEQVRHHEENLKKLMEEEFRVKDIVNIQNNLNQQNNIQTQTNVYINSLHLFYHDGGLVLREGSRTSQKLLGEKGRG